MYRFTRKPSWQRWLDRGQVPRRPPSAGNAGTIVPAFRATRQKRPPVSVEHIRLAVSSLDEPVRAASESIHPPARASAARRRISSRTGPLMLAPVVACSTLLGSAGSYAQCEYDVTVIQPPQCPIWGPPPTFGLGLNELGEVVGARWQCGSSWTDDAAFLWTAESGLVVLDMPAGTRESQAFDINDAGKIAGSFDVANDGFSVLAFFRDGDQFIVLPPPAGTFSQASAITNEAVVAGTTADGTSFFKGFIWENDVMTLILPTFGPRSVVKDMNERGQVVGWMGTSVSIDAHGYVWEDGIVTDLGIVPGGSTGQVTAINNLGHVIIVGRVQGTAGTVSRSFLWNDGEFTDLGVLPGFDITVGWDINDFDQVVGICSKISNPNDRAPFIWQQGIMTDLNDLVSAEDVSVTAADAINNAGQIAATGGTNFAGAALLLSPINLNCPGDLDCDGFVGITDFLGLLAVWGPNPGHPADLDGDGSVGIVDFLMLLGNWGACP